MLFSAPQRRHFNRLHAMHSDHAGVEPGVVAEVLLHIQVPHRRLQGESCL